MFYIKPKNIFVDQLLSLVSKGVKSLTELEANMSVCNAKLVDLLRVWTVNCVWVPKDILLIFACNDADAASFPLYVKSILICRYIRLSANWKVGSSGLLLYSSCLRQTTKPKLRSNAYKVYIRCLQCSGNVLFKSQSIYQDNMLSFKYLISIRPGTICSC